MGSVALLPRGMLHWRVSFTFITSCSCNILCVYVKVNDVEELTPESFTLFHLIEPQIGEGQRGDHIALD